MTPEDKAKVQQALDLLNKQWQCSEVWSLEESQESAEALRQLLEQPADLNLGCKSVQARLATQWGYVQAWQPIESAPTDGSIILVCLPRQMDLVVRARYNNVHKFWMTDYEGEGGVCRPHWFHEGDLWHPIPPLYITPPAQPAAWVGLTDEECIEIAARGYPRWLEFAQAVEAKLREKNGGGA